MLTDTQRAAYGAHNRAGRAYPSCICAAPANFKRNEDGSLYVYPECGYHQIAAEFPDDHSIPWNCPTYWDGCNCDDPAFTSTAKNQERRP